MGGNLSGGKEYIGKVLYEHIGILPLQVKLIRHRIFRMRFGCSVVWSFWGEGFLTVRYPALEKAGDS